MTLVKIKNQRDGNRSRRNRAFPISSDFVFDHVAYDLVEARFPYLEAEAEG